MITGELRSKIDAIWNTFWSGGISNPMEVIEQITYLLFLRRLDDLHTLEENKSARLKSRWRGGFSRRGRMVLVKKAGVRLTICGGRGSKTRLLPKCLRWLLTTSFRF